MCFSFSKNPWVLVSKFGWYYPKKLIFVCSLWGESNEFDFPLKRRWILVRQKSLDSLSCGIFTRTVFKVFSSFQRVNPLAKRSSRCPRSLLPARPVRTVTTGTWGSGRSSDTSRCSSAQAKTWTSSSQATSQDHRAYPVQVKLKW